MYHQHDRKRADTLDYLQSMLAQLKLMADSEGFDMLAYLIDMASIEAKEMAHAEAQARPGARPARDLRPGDR